MSLRLKMILGIGAILLVTTLVYSFIGLRRQATHLLNMARREADLIAAVTDRAISRAMEQGKTGEVQAILERIGEDPDLAGIRIVDSGERSSARTECGRWDKPLRNVNGPRGERQRSRSGIFESGRWQSSGPS